MGRMVDGEPHTFVEPLADLLLRARLQTLSAPVPITQHRSRIFGV